jgi:2-(1,2-epoxy-1,2-dihydrophenyl)acetyl-CoA isomerase
MADSVLYEVNNSLATITINRPHQMNAVDLEAKNALRDAVEAAAADPAARAVLLTGAGDRAFCVGQDLKEHIGLLTAAHADAQGSDGDVGAAARRDVMSTVREHYNPIVRALVGMPKPVVAAVNGVAAGAGFGFALAADFRVVADTASFTTAFAGVALTADSGLSWTLQRVVGPGRATDLLLFPRSISAQEAYEFGIAGRVVPAAELTTEAGRVARALAEGPTLAYAAIKESVAYAGAHSLEESLGKEAELQARAGASEDHVIAVQAFVDKQKPRFVGR